MSNATQHAVCECGERIYYDSDGLRRHVKSNSLQCGTVSRAGMMAAPRQGVRQ